MHHFDTKNLMFNYNPDFSEVHIGTHDAPGEWLIIDGAELLDFVAQCYVAPEKIRRLEQAETKSVLFG